MRKIVGLIIFLLAVTSSYSQINAYSKPTQHVYKSTYVSPDWNLLMQIMDKKTAQYDENSEYLDALLDYIFEIKSKTSDLQLHKELNIQHNKLMNLANTDLSLAGNSLRHIEYSIKGSVGKFISREKEKNNPEKYYRLGLQFLEKKDYSEAISNFSKVIELVPDYEPAYVLRAQCYSDIDNNRNALRDLNKSLELNPNNTYALYQRGWCFNRDAKYTDAISDFNKIIELKPDQDYGYYGRGYAKSHLLDYYGSNQDYLKTIEINPNHSMAHNNLGWNYFEKGKFNKALEYVNKALEIDTKNSVAWDSRAEIYFNLKNYDQCIRDCDRALLLNPNIANSYFLKGRSFYRLGKKDNACKEWSRAGENGKFEAYEYIDKYCN
jgi:tetratricopeptide (TPR) repeat protein